MSKRDELILKTRLCDEDEWIEIKRWKYSFYSLAAIIRRTEEHEKRGHQVKVERVNPKEYVGHFILRIKTKNDMDDYWREHKTWIKFTKSNILEIQEEIKKLESEGYETLVSTK